jgi:hypothetical protein
MLPTLIIKEKIRNKLINDAIKDLQRWIFPNVNKINIFTDITYSYFFYKILLKKKGENAQIDEVINELLIEINNSQKNV